MRIVFSILVLSGILLSSCNKLPEVKHPQFTILKKYKTVNDTLKLHISNTIKSPIVIIPVDLNDFYPALKDTIILNSDADTLLALSNKWTKETTLPKIKYGMIDTLPVQFSEIQYPFSKGKKVRIMQAYNGSFSHNTPFSRYAIDFALKQGDTIQAVADGIVVGIVNQYSHGGNNKKWRDFANYITIYHPDMHLYSQYVHLKKDGNLVTLNELVKAGTPIGISGKTGYTSKEHLHFNIFSIDLSGTHPVQVTFKGGKEGADLNIGDWVSH